MSGPLIAWLAAIHGLLVQLIAGKKCLKGVICGPATHGLKGSTLTRALA